MEMRIALDTNRLTDLFQGDAALAAFLGTCDEVWIPFVVLAEMKAGFYGGTRQTQNEETRTNCHRAFQSRKVGGGLDRLALRRFPAELQNPVILAELVETPNC